MPFRLAAVGDLHCYLDGHEEFRLGFGGVNEEADVLFLCGDLTRRGKMSEIETLIDELADVEIPTLAVLGNHDYHEKNNVRFKETLKEAGIVTLDGDTYEITAGGLTVGFTGTKGFAGGFGLRALPDFGEQLWRDLYREVVSEVEKIRKGLAELQTQIKVVGLHYAPVLDTITGEDPQIYPFLGSSLLSAAIDEVGADLVLHGHAHYGQEKGRTPGGVPVRNVALPMIRASYHVYELPIVSLR